jgi:hypothetical protein
MQEDNFANGDQNMADQKAECINLKTTYQQNKLNFEEQIRVLRETIYVLEANIDELISENAGNI